VLPTSIGASASSDTPISFHAWTTTTDFSSGTVSGSAKVTDFGGGAVTLMHRTSEGSWISGSFSPGFPVNQIVSSWQVDTPGATWIEMRLSVRVGDRWSKKFIMGKWAFDSSGIQRTSVSGQDDADGSISVDTYLTSTNGPAGAYQLEVVLHGDGTNVPTVRQVAATASDPQAPTTTVSRTTVDRTIDLPVPMYSQYVHDGEFPQFGGGGEAWCSPTSTAMVLQYWGRGPNQADLQTMPADPVFDQHSRVDSAVDWAAIHTFDQDFGADGNWPFNTAYSSHYDLDGSVRQSNSIQGLERWIKQGVPLVVSINWDNSSADPLKHLDGASITKTAGHLMVVRGITSSGDVITNDPASPAGDATVRHVYRRDQFENRWQAGSTGVFYLVKPYGIN
jgi:hypothetical protein